MTPTIRRLTAIVLAGTLLLACGDDDDTATVSGEVPAATDTTETTGGEDAAGEVEVTGAWARTSPAVATAGAAYFEITNGTDTDDILVAARVEPSVAATVELHETTTAGEAPMGGETDGEMTETSMGEAPMMEMKPVDDIPVPSGATVSLEPGGLHIMMLDLVEPLQVGDSIDITLTFEQAGDVVVTAEVRDMAP